MEPTPCHLRTLILSLHSLPSRPKWQISPDHCLLFFASVPSGGSPCFSSQHGYILFTVLITFSFTLFTLWGPPLTVHSYIPKTQNWYLAYQRPSIYFCWEKNELLSKRAIGINAPISSKNAHFVSSLIEAVFLEYSSRDGIVLDTPPFPPHMGSRGEVMRLFSNRYCSHMNKDQAQTVTARYVPTRPQ